MRLWGVILNGVLLGIDSRLVEIIEFNRVSESALRRIANRVLISEGVTADMPAIEQLVASNPGDIRALVRDLQAICGSSDHIDMQAVLDQIEMGQINKSIYSRVWRTVSYHQSG